MNNRDKNDKLKVLTELLSLGCISMELRNKVEQEIIRLLNNY